jgi:uncharacterized repeat protein (TIGR02543 family)
MGAANVTLYAVWAANPTRTMTFNANGGTGVMSPQSIASGATVNLSANVFAFPGKSFTGWATQLNGSVVYADQGSYTMGAANVTLYAVWAANPTRTLTFNANGGTGVMSPQSIASGAIVNLSANAFTFPGKTFSGWAMNPSGAAAYADQAPYTMGTADVTLYAVWIPNPSHTVTFYPNGGTGTMSPESMVNGTSAPLSLNAFSMTGWRFVGWGTSAGATTAAYADGATFSMGTQDVKLYALWAPRATVVLSFPSFATTTPRLDGLMWDGTRLWVAETDDIMIYQLDPTSGAKIGSGFRQVNETHALVTEPGANFFWGTDYWTDPPHLYRYAMSDGSLQRTINLTSDQYAPMAMTYDPVGSALWVVNQNPNPAVHPSVFTKIDYTTGSILTTWSVPNLSGAYGMCMDKTDNSIFWVNLGVRLFKISTATHAIIDQYAFPSGAVGEPHDLKMIDATTFWMIDANKETIIKVQIQ